MLLLLNSSAYSQDITLNEKQAKEIIKDKRQLIHLTSLSYQQNLLISSLESLTDNLKAQISTIELENSLVTKNYKSALERIEIISKQDENWFKNVLIGIGVFATGFLIGSL